MQGKDEPYIIRVMRMLTPAKPAAPSSRGLSRVSSSASLSSKGTDAKRRHHYRHYPTDPEYAALLRRVFLEDTEGESAAKAIVSMQQLQRMKHAHSKYLSVIGKAHQKLQSSRIRAGSAEVLWDVVFTLNQHVTRAFQGVARAAEEELVGSTRAARRGRHYLTIDGAEEANSHFRGIPPEERSYAWRAAIGNAAFITKGAIEALETRLKLVSPPFCECLQRNFQHQLSSFAANSSGSVTYSHDTSRKPPKQEHQAAERARKDKSRMEAKGKCASASASASANGLGSKGGDNGSSDSNALEEARKEIDRLKMEVARLQNEHEKRQKRETASWGDLNGEGLLDPGTLLTTSSITNTEDHHHHPHHHEHHLLHHHQQQQSPQQKKHDQQKLSPSSHIENIAPPGTTSTKNKEHPTVLTMSPSMPPQQQQQHERPQHNHTSLPPNALSSSVPPPQPTPGGSRVCQGEGAEATRKRANNIKGGGGQEDAKGEGRHHTRAWCPSCEPVLHYKQSLEKDLATVDQDMPRTFADHEFFRKEETQRGMRYVLKLFVLYRPDIGYTQGMSYLAGQLIWTIKDKRQAFVCFANLLCTNRLFQALFTHRDILNNRVRARVDLLKLLLANNATALYRHLGNIGFLEACFTDLFVKWVITLFGSVVGPGETWSAIWDSFLIHGEIAVYKTAVAVLRLLAVQLRNTQDPTQCQAVLQERHKFHHAQLMKEIDAISISKTFRQNMDVLQAREAVEGIWDDAYYRRGSASGPAGPPAWDRKT
mmetsp:Transcript_2330/g.4473  ORF Transcript_2330/g.4473 Transcript_2330/m.4473 type:complete len:765 (-) Transcript_2330:212-2506(-)